MAEKHNCCCTIKDTTTKVHSAGQCKDFFLGGGEGFTPIHVCLFVTEAKSFTATADSGQAGGKDPRSFPLWMSQKYEADLHGCSCVSFISNPERTEPVVCNTIKRVTLIYISPKRKDFKGFIGILIKSCFSASFQGRIFWVQQGIKNIYGKKYIQRKRSTVLYSDDATQHSNRAVHGTLTSRVFFIQVKPTN